MNAGSKYVIVQKKFKVEYLGTSKKNK